MIKTKTLQSNAVLCALRAAGISGLTATDMAKMLAKTTHCIYTHVSWLRKNGVNIVHTGIRGEKYRLIETAPVTPTPQPIMLTEAQKDEVITRAASISLMEGASMETCFLRATQESLSKSGLNIKGSAMRVMINPILWAEEFSLKRAQLLSKLTTPAPASSTMTPTELANISYAELLTAIGKKLDGLLLQQAPKVEVPQPVPVKVAPPAQTTPPNLMSAGFPPAGYSGGLVKKPARVISIVGLLESQRAQIYNYGPIAHLIKGQTLELQFLPKEAQTLHFRAAAWGTIVLHNKISHTQWEEVRRHFPPRRIFTAKGMTAIRNHVLEQATAAV